MNRMNRLITSIHDGESALYKCRLQKWDLNPGFKEVHMPFPVKPVEYAITIRKFTTQNLGKIPVQHRCNTGDLIEHANVISAGLVI